MISEIRIALFSDVHGNPIALQAVLDDLRIQGGFDEIWVLGDLAALGHAPEQTLEMLASLPNTRFTRGNTDRYLVTGERPPPGPHEIARNPKLLPVLLEVHASFAWSCGALAHTAWLEWLAALPLELRLELPNGVRLLGVHASPMADDDHGLRPGLSTAQLDAVLGNCQADLVCAGHTHHHWQTKHKDLHLCNLGSVSNPLASDLRASYVILDAGDKGYRLTSRRVPFDLQASIQAFEKLHHPGATYISKYFQGRHNPPWLTGN